MGGGVQAEWQMHNQWEMPIIHLLLLQLMERIYAVRPPRTKVDWTG